MQFVYKCTRIRFIEKTKNALNKLNLLKFVHLFFIISSATFRNKLFIIVLT